MRDTDVRERTLLRRFEFGRTGELARSCGNGSRVYLEKHRLSVLLICKRLRPHLAVAAPTPVHAVRGAATAKCTLVRRWCVSEANRNSSDVRSIDSIDSALGLTTKGLVLI